VSRRELSNVDEASCLRRLATAAAFRRINSAGYVTAPGWQHATVKTGSILLGVSAGLLLLPAVVTVRLGDVLISISTIAGVSTLLLAALMALCAASALLRVDTRLPAGVCAMILSLVAIPAANFGGLIMGTLAGVVGSAFVLAWIPVDSTVAATPDSRSDRV